MSEEKDHAKLEAFSDAYYQYLDDHCDKREIIKKLLEFDPTGKKDDDYQDCNNKDEFEEYKDGKRLL